MIGTLIMPVLIGIVVTIICCGFYVSGYHDAMKKAEDMLDQEFEKKFKDAGIVVKKDDRIIECNGMISNNCKKCIFGRQPVYNVIECFAPDFDGVPVFGVKKDRMVKWEHKNSRCTKSGVWMALRSFRDFSIR